MAFNELLAERVRAILLAKVDIKELKMFGGLCFMLNGHMGCGIMGERLMVRVGPEFYDEALEKAHVSAMDFTGRPMVGMIYIEAEGLKTAKQLSSWLDLVLKFIATLPPKSPRKKL